QSSGRPRVCSLGACSQVLLTYSLLPLFVLSLGVVSGSSCWSGVRASLFVPIDLARHFTSTCIVSRLSSHVLPFFTFLGLAVSPVCIEAGHHLNVGDTASLL